MLYGRICQGSAAENRVKSLQKVNHIAITLAKAIPVNIRPLPQADGLREKKFFGGKTS